MSDTDRNDTEGLAREAREDPEAFAALFRRLRGRLQMWISLRMGPLLKARLTEDDVLQETFIQAHRSLSDFENQGPDSFRRWIFSVAENRLRDLHKFHTRQKRDAARELSPSPDETALIERLAGDGKTPSSIAKKSELVERLAEAIEALPESLREVLVLRAIEERTFQEIADLLDRRRATVQAQYVRALRSLKDGLAAGS